MFKGVKVFHEEKDSHVTRRDNGLFTNPLFTCL